MSKELLCNIWDVEFGSAAYISAPNGQNILLDAGLNQNGFSPSNHLKNAYKIKTIDLFVLSHPHNDHLQDLPNIVENFTISRIHRNKNTPKRLIDYTASAGLIAWKKLDDTYNTPGDNVDYGLTLKSYGAYEAYLRNGKDNLNNYSLLTTYTYNNVALIFPGDLEPDGWDAILNYTSFTDDLNATYNILIAPHHGRASGVRRNGTPYTSFLEAIKPDITIISDKYGSESTESTLYAQYSLGLDIIDANKQTVKRKIVSTKMVNSITIKIDDTYFPYVFLS